MKKIIILIIFLLFIFNKDIVISSSIESLYIWNNILYPIIFPSLIICDLLLSSNILYYITKPFNKYSTYIYILLLSLISSTPSNIKVLNNLNLDNKEFNKILASVIIFNPLFIIKYTSLKIYIIIFISNIITILINRNKYITNNNINIPNYKFDLTESIKTNIIILLYILGTITVFNIISNIIIINNIYIKVLLSGLLEITSGLNKLVLITNTTLKDIISIIVIGFGGISIYIQIKSIINDTLINTKYYFYNRLLVILISIIIYSIFS